MFQRDKKKDAALFFETDFVLKNYFVWSASMSACGACVNRFIICVSSGREYGQFQELLQEIRICA
jgi:hypothetical protein